MSGNKQTGLTHLQVYIFVIYRTGRETVACIIIKACRSPRKDVKQQFSRLSVNLEKHIKEDEDADENLTI